MLKLFERCPACGGDLIITECRCPACRLQLRGEFGAGLFASLSDEQLTFIRAFLRARGNLTELEKVLGVSYPTIRNKLDEINAALERAEATSAPRQAAIETPATAGPHPGREARQDILKQVAQGSLTPAEALRRLQNLREGAHD